MADVMATTLENSMPQPNSTSLSGTVDSRSRSPYVIKACEECRRRKIRCNGAQPCRRCDRLSLVCFTRAKRQHNSHPEQSLDLHTTLAELNTLRADYEALANGSGRGSSASGSPPPLSQRIEGLKSYRTALLEDVYPKDPLMELSSDEIRRLMYVYDEHVQFLYPVADMDEIEDSAALLDQHRNLPHPEQVLEEADGACLKLVLANAMAVDDRSHGDLPMKLFESAQPYVSGLPDSDRLDVKALRAFVLVVSCAQPSCFTRSSTDGDRLGTVLLHARQACCGLAQHWLRRSHSHGAGFESAEKGRRDVPTTSTAYCDPATLLVHLYPGSLLESAHGLRACCQGSRSRSWDRGTGMLHRDRQRDCDDTSLQPYRTTRCRFCAPWSIAPKSSAGPGKSYALL